MSQSSVLLIYTGGTIGMIEDAESGMLQPFDFNRVHEHVPELNSINAKMEIHSFEHPIDSSDVSTGTWILIADIIEDRYNDFDGFVVLHGTDTMAYSASALSFMLENLNKPVIFTGSQLPIGVLRTDGVENLISAIEIAADRKNGHARIQEVAVYFGSNLYRGNRTHKYNTGGFDAINSLNYPPLADVGVHKVFREHRFLKPTGKGLVVHRGFEERIALIKVFPGIHRSVVERILETPELKGVVLETYGSGNAPRADWLIKALEMVISKGIPVVNVTQCSKGFVEQGRYETSRGLQKIGVQSGGDMTTESALTKMMHLLGKGDKREVFNNNFQRSMRGELSEVNALI
jgi:L-asparaginase